MLLLAIMWGFSIPIPPLTLTALRFPWRSPLFLSLAAGRLRVPWQAVPSIIALGVMGINLGNVARSGGFQAARLAGQNDAMQPRTTRSARQGHWSADCI